jgi:tetratricopeptide (TPR) repeat protein
MVVVQRHLESAQALIAAGRWNEALAPLSAALRRDPRNKDVHQTLGIVHAALGDHARAIDAFRACLDLPPHRNDRVPRFELASAYVRLGKPDRAIEHLEWILEREPDDLETWFNLGVARQAQGRPTEARSAWERVLLLDPEHEPARRALEGLGGR